MTIVIPNQSEPGKPGRPVGSRGNGKTMAEIVAREKRKLAIIEMESKATEARAAAEEISKITELRAEQKARVTETYVKQEAARAPQFQIDQRPTLYLLGALAALMFVAAAVLTADGTIGSAAAARFVEPWMGFLLFGVFEVAILVFMLLYYVTGSRVDYEGKRVPSEHWFWLMVFASAVTVIASAYHVMDVYDYDFANIDLWVGIGLRVVAALFFVLVSKGIASVLFAKAILL